MIILFQYRLSFVIYLILILLEWCFEDMCISKNDNNNESIHSFVFALSISNTIGYTKNNNNRIQRQYGFNGGYESTWCSRPFQRTNQPTPIVNTARMQLKLKQQQQQQPPNNQRHEFVLLSSKGTTALFASSSSKSTSTLRYDDTNNNRSSTEFEYQELKLIMDGMYQQKVSSSDIPLLKRNEIAEYARKIVTNRQYNNPQSILLWSTSQTKQMFQSILPGSTWRLGFSSDSTTTSDLPKDATVYLKFMNDKTNPKSSTSSNNNYGTMVYMLQFSDRTFGLQNIQATCSWTVDDQGIVTFVYDKITTDVFGMKNINLGFFGLLQGRVGYVKISYFDNYMWIEQQGDSSSSNNKDSVNVYVRVDDDDRW